MTGTDQPEASGAVPDGTSRRRVGRRAAVAALVAVVAAAGVVTAVRDDGSGQGPPGGKECAGEGALSAPPSLDSGDARNADPSAPGGEWKRLGPDAVADPCFRLIANRRDAAGVAADTDFTLSGGLSVAQATERLRVDPAVPLKFRAGGGGGALTVTPETPLAEDSVYRFTLLDEEGRRPVGRWSFQSQGELSVVGTLPADRSTGVPRNTGIELTFSHDDVSAPEELLSVTPKVEGRFERHRRTVVFVPKALQPATLYTVTLRAGAAVPGSGQKLGEDTTFRFETGTDDRDPDARDPELRRGLLTFTRPVWESPVGEAPAVGLVDSGEPGAPEAGVSPRKLTFAVHRFATVEDFVASLDGLARIPDWSAFARSRYAASLDGLKQVATFESTLEKGGPAGEAFARFPEPLPAGWYLVTTDLVTTAPAGDRAPRQAQTWLQVTDLAPYAAVSATRSVVWVNDVRRKGAVAGVPVRVAGAGGDPVATTGDDGIAAFDTPKELARTTDGALGTEASGVGNLIVGKAGGAQAVVPLSVTLAGASTFSFRANEFYGDPGRYWRTLQTDRTLYRTTDTVNVWGLIRPRVPGGPSVVAGDEPVDVEVIGYRPEGGEVVVARARFPRKASGTFIGKVPLSGIDPGYYTLRAGFDKAGVATAGLEVRDFVKPAYRLDVTPSKRAILRGDEVTYRVSAAFFEGTPVPGARLRVGGDDGGPGAEVTTDAAGRAAITKRPNPDIYGAYGHDTFSVRPLAAEEGEITGRAEVRVFAAALAMEGQARRTGDEAVIDGRVFAVDLAKANSDQDLGDVAGYEGPPAAGVPVKVEVTETSYRQIETGEYYDFIAKANRKSYRYDEVTGPPVTRTVTTDSRGRYEAKFPAPADRTFRVVVSVSDDRGRVARTEQYLGSGLLVPDLTTLDAGGYEARAVGDEVTVRLTRDATDLPTGGDNRYLFVKAQQGIRSHTITDGPRYRFDFAAADVPSVAVLGVRFTGTTYDVASEPANLFFDKESRRLAVEVTATERRYAPGAEAGLEVKVTDRAGKPVEGAEVLLSAVDERVYLLSESAYLGQSDALSDLYEPVASGLLGGYASHVFPGTGARGGGAESGEGGDGRSDFRDAVLFQAVTTDAGGRAGATFKLPDDLTSWRVSAIAVGDDLAAGTGLTLVPVALPVFADLGMAESYLLDDRPVLRLRAFGEALSGGDPVKFTVSAPGLLAGPVVVDAKAFETAALPLPALVEGRHQVTVTVEGGGRTDRLTRPLVVVRSRLTDVAATFSEVAEGAAWKPPGGDARRDVVVTDHNRGRFYPDVADLAWTPGDRVDQALARDLADALLAEHFGEGIALPSTFRGSAYQAESGGITLLPFSDADLVLSARVAALAPDRFGRRGLARYFTGILDDRKTPRDRAFVALYGLAAIGEPVLETVRRNAEAPDLGVVEALYTGLAAAALGDDEVGRAMYRSALRRAGEERGAAVRIKLEDEERSAQASALAAVLGAQIGDAAAPRLESWVIANPPDDDLTVLERISFLVAALPRTPGEPVKFSYAIGGKRVVEELDRGRSKVLAVTAKELAALDLRAERGTLGVAERSLVPLEPATVKADPALAVNRKLPAKIGAGDLVRVELVVRGPGKGGCNQVSDLLPSGLRAVSEPYRYGREGDRLNWPYAVDGQRVRFCSFGSGPIVYLARVVSPGSYVAEPALIRSGKDPTAIALSAAGRIEIR